MVGLLVFAKLQWRAANFLAEAADVVAGRAEAIVVGDAADGGIRGEQGIDAAFDAIVDEIIEYGTVHVALEKAAAFAAAEMYGIGKGLQAELFAVVVMHERKKKLEAFVILLRDSGRRIFFWLQLYELLPDREQVDEDAEFISLGLKIVELLQLVEMFENDELVRMFG